MSKSSKKEVFLDLTSFSSDGDALAKAQAPIAEYERLARSVLVDSNPSHDLTLLHILIASTMLRARSLHEGAVREIQKGNPQAVFALLRALLETWIVPQYVLDHPESLEVFVLGERDGPGVMRRPTTHRLVDNAARAYEGLPRVYEQLSDVGAHFGSLAMWSHWQVVDAEQHLTRYSTVPHWRDDEDLKKACGQLIESATCTVTVCQKLFTKHPKGLGKVAARIDAAG